MTEPYPFGNVTEKHGVARRTMRLLGKVLSEVPLLAPAGAMWLGGGVLLRASIPGSAAAGAKGDTESFPLPTQLHYKLRRGVDDTTKKSFGLAGADQLSGRV